LTINDLKNENYLNKINQQLNRFGFANEGIELLFSNPMIINGKESLGSMENDASLAFIITTKITI